MSSWRDSDTITDDQKAELKEERIKSAEREISQNLKAYVLRYQQSSSIGYAMDVALGVDRNPILIKALRELADLLEKGVTDAN